MTLQWTIKIESVFILILFSSQLYTQMLGFVFPLLSVILFPLFLVLGQGKGSMKNLSLYFPDINVLFPYKDYNLQIESLLLHSVKWVVLQMTLDCDRSVELLPLPWCKDHSRWRMLPNSWGKLGWTVFKVALPVALSNHLSRVSSASVN